MSTAGNSSCPCSLRKTAEAKNPGWAGAISWPWSPEGPFSALIIYEMLPPSGFLGKKKRWCERGRRDIKGMHRGPSRDYGWVFLTVSLGARCRKVQS